MSASATRQRSRVNIVATYVILAIAVAIFCLAPAHAQSDAPKFEVDPSWPKPLPNRWVTGEIGGVCVDSQDHVFVLQRVSDVGGMDNHLEGLTDDELNAGVAAPPVMEFDPQGTVVNSWETPSFCRKICTAAPSTAKATSG